MSHGARRGAGRGRGSAGHLSSGSEFRNPQRMLPLCAIAALIAAACINSTVPLAPQCTAAINVDLSAEEIHPGDMFVATASSRGDECLSNLMWTAQGVISLRSAEGHSATFEAEESGTGTIRVLNDKGNLGIREVTVEESEEPGAGRER